jgi:6-phosphogluconolactonase (cycloisomerase 2 family)
VFTVNQDTGVLSGSASSKVGTRPDAIAVEPSGKFAYVANRDTHNISMFAINQETGDLSRVGITGTYGLSVTMHPSGRFAYAANINSNDVSVFTITPGTGALVAGKSVAAGINPVSVTLDAGGKFAYVPNLNSNNISV